MRYYIADTHFFHNAMNTRMDQRGFSSIEEMNEYMILQWNNKVRKNDEVVILGDFSWGKAKETNEILERLHGKLYMIRGNHDKWLNDKAANTKRFIWIKDYAEMNDNGRKVVLCHYPIMCYNGQYRLDKDGKPKTYMLYGHVHNTLDQALLKNFQNIMKNTYVQAFGYNQPKLVPCNMINCFCMFSDYVPLSLDEWILHTSLDM